MQTQRKVFNDDVTIDDARRVAAAINAYMTEHFKEDTPCHGAKVQWLGVFQHASFYGDPCRIWVVNEWQNSAFLPDRLLFVEDANGRVRLSSGERSFLPDDLYPSEIPQTPQADQVAQEGGVA